MPLRMSGILNNFLLTRYLKRWQGTLLNEMTAKWRGILLEIYASIYGYMLNLSTYRCNWIVYRVYSQNLIYLYIDAGEAS